MKTITVLAILVVAVCGLVSGRPDGEKEKPLRTNGPQKQNEIEQLAKNFDAAFAKKYEDIQKAMAAIMGSDKPKAEKLKEAKVLWNPLGLDYLFKAWNMQLVEWYSPSIEEANKDFESIFKPDAETATARKILNVLRISSYEIPNSGDDIEAVPDRLRVLKEKGLIVKNLLNEQDPSLVDIEDIILEIYDNNSTYRDQTNSLKEYIKTVDASKITKLAAIADVYYKYESEDNETLAAKVKEALKKF